LAKRRELHVTPAVLAIDIGSSSTRVLVFALDGTVLAAESRPSLVKMPTPDQVVLDPEHLWRQILEMITGLDRGGFAVHGIGVTAQLGLVTIDREGAPVGEAILWSDRRAIAEAEELDRIAGDVFRQLSGRRMTPELAAPRLKWLARHRPELYATIHRVMSLKDFIVFRLTSAIVTDETHASYSGLFDVERRYWSDELAALAGVDMAMLPRTFHASEAAGRLTKDAAEAMGLRSGTVVAVGASDGTVGTIGAGAVRAGVTVDVAGTTDVILHTVDRPMRDPKGAAILSAHALAGLWTIGGPTGLTGGAVAWTARLLGFPSASAAEVALAGMLSKLGPGSEGLVFRPTLAGSRFPDWRAEERGLIAGIETWHGPAHLFRAAEEGAAFTVASGLSALRRSGVDVKELVIVGGLATNPSALQLRADVLNVSVLPVLQQEASAVGAAMLAGLASGTLPDLQAAATTFVRYAERFVPDAAVSSRFREAEARWSAVVSAV
jgi:xylulokinase